jgi:predicted cupin superfamily sugar epimerase
MQTQSIIQQLQLLPHPEGGYYKETYRGEQLVAGKNGKPRNVSTAIYYMLQNDDKSHFHRIQSDELWFFHQGEAFEIVAIINGNATTFVLGNDFAGGAMPQVVIPANTWFASRVKNGKGYALASCTVAPGFDFDDFEMAARQELIAEYPHLADVIITFTKP